MGSTVGPDLVEFDNFFKALLKESEAVLLRDVSLDKLAPEFKEVLFKNNRIVSEEIFFCLKIFLLLVAGGLVRVLVVVVVVTVVVEMVVETKEEVDGDGGLVSVVVGVEYVVVDVVVVDVVVVDDVPVVVVAGMLVTGFAVICVVVVEP